MPEDAEECTIHQYHALQDHNTRSHVLRCCRCSPGVDKNDSLPLQIHTRSALYGRSMTGGSLDTVTLQDTFKNVLMP